MNIKKLFLLIMILFSCIGLANADTDGIWHEAEDFRGGTLGSDEGTPDFTLNSRLSLGPNGYIDNNGGDTFVKVRASGNRKSGVSLYANNATPSWRLGRDNSNGFFIDRNNNNYFYISAGGQAGIGTNNPQEKLHVVGTIRGTNLKIGNLTTSEIYVDEGQADSITSNMIVDGTIQLGDIQPGILDSIYVNEAQANSITSSMIVDGTIVAGDINLLTVDPFYVNENQANSITTGMLVDGTIQVADINNAQFDNRYVNEAQANSITSSMIVDGTIVAGDINLLTIDSRYVNEGQVNSITSNMIVDGAISISDLNLGSIDTRYVNENQINSITSNMIVNGAITNNDINSNLVQERVTGTCGVDSSITSITSTGGVACEPDDKGVETVNAGNGLNGGGSSSTVSLSVNTGVIQNRVSGTCGADSAIRVISSSGTVTCDPDDGIRTVNAGSGINGGGSGSTISISADTGYLQRRVSGSCSSGQYIRSISSNGGVTCETVPTFWESAGGSTIRPSGANNIQVGGQIRANSFVYSSDERLKENIVDLSNSLEMVKKLNPVAYNMKETGNFEVGLIAQEVQQVVPGVVSEGNEYLGVDYARLVPYLVGAIQEQQAQIEELKERVESLEE